MKLPFLPASWQRSGEVSARLKRWHGIEVPDLSAEWDAVRCVVVDVETTGLDVFSDKLIAIGAVAVQHGRVNVSDSFECVLNEPVEENVENVLVHRITASDRAAGVASQEALLGFLEYAAKSPLIAFHAGFDRTFVERAMREHLGLRFGALWLDLADVTQFLMPGTLSLESGLDGWLDAFSIGVKHRHRAIEDAFATAQLALVCAERAKRKPIRSFKAIVRHADAHAQLGR